MATPPAKYSKVIQNALDTLGSDQTDYAFKTEIRFLSSTEESFDVLSLENLDMVFDLIGDNFQYWEHIEIDVVMILAERMKLQAQQNNLHCRLRIYREEDPYSKNKRAIRVEPELIYDRTFLAIITNRQNIQATASAGDIARITDDSDKTTTDFQPVKVTFELVDPIVYAVRKTSVNAIFHDVKVDELLLIGATAFGFEKVGCNLTPASNTRVYKNYRFPANLKFDEFFPFLQEQIGVYEEGLLFHINDGVLNVWPRYKVPEKSNGMIQLYRAQPEDTPGPSTYMKQDKTTKIVLTGVASLTDLTDRDVEATGDEQLVVNTADFFSWATPTEEGMTIPNDHVTWMQSPVLSNIDKRMSNPELRFVNGNPMRTTEQIHKIGWKYCVFTVSEVPPGILKPNQFFRFTHDGDDRVPTSYTGQMVAMHLKGKRVGNLVVDSHMEFVSTVTLQVELEE